MAHFAVGFLALGHAGAGAERQLGPRRCWSFPSILSAYIIRLRTVADRDTVTARSLLSSETVRWEDIEGLRFGKALVGARAAQGRLANCCFPR